MLRVALLGDGPLLDALARGVVAAGHDLCGVVTRNSRPRLGGGLLVARSGVNRERVLGRLRGLGPDLLLVGSWPERIGPSVLECPPLGCINCHPSRLPVHRGPNPYLSAIVAGETVTGVTFHGMIPSWDAGPIWLQREVPIGVAETGGTLRARCVKAAEEMVPELLGGLLDGTLQSREQDETQSTYFPLPDDRDLEIDWRQPARHIHDWIRGVQPWLCCHSHLGEQRVAVGASKVVAVEGKSRRPGEVLAVRGEVVIVATGDPLAAIRLSRIRPVAALRRLRVGGRLSGPP